MQESPITLPLPVERFHQYQGRTNDCAPFTLATAVNALTGRQLDGAELAREMDRPRLSRGPLPLPVVRRVPGWATFPWGMVDILQEQGLRASWRFGAKEADLLSALRAGRLAMPIIGSLWPLWAHVMILVSHDPRRGWGFVDPATPAPGARWETAESFARLWRNYGNLLVEAGG